MIYFGEIDTFGCLCCTRTTIQRDWALCLDQNKTRSQRRWKQCWQT